uniref:Uncharacterized protein n=1 Tax=Fundulus heteroclitus TaxID=8078 RepID=A0A3Q2NSF8_FUNHE
MRSVYVALLLTLTSLHAARRSLNSINDLITCLQSEQTNILELLHWFACEVEIDRNNVIRLTFDPSSGDYGSHRYRNLEGLLESPPRGYQYYTIGNIHQHTSVTLPTYVVNSLRRNILWNSARILIGVNEGGAEAGEIIDQVYITQHYDASENQGSSYDPEHTYRITTHFLRQLKELSINEIQRLAQSSQTGSFTNTSAAHSQKTPRRAGRM